MLILAIDTALARCSAALWRDGRILAGRALDISRGHSECLMPMVTEVMAKAGAAFSDLSRFAVTTGPGSFTGVRIGLAAARGLALARNLPLVGVTTLETVAFAAVRRSAGRPILAVLDAGRPDLFLQRFATDGSAQGEIVALPPEDAARVLPETPVLVAGNAEARLRPVLRNRGDLEFFTIVPDAADVAALAALREPAPEMPAPVYVHPPYAKLPEPK